MCFFSAASLVIGRGFLQERRQKTIDGVAIISVEPRDWHRVILSAQTNDAGDGADEAAGDDGAEGGGDDVSGGEQN